MIIDRRALGTGRVIGYARVSSRDQRLRMQDDALSAVPCDQIFTDRISGSTTDRPGLDELLQTLQSGDTVVVYRLDRLGRSVLHLANLLDRFERDGIGFLSLTEGINTTTPGGRLVFNLFAAFAEFQRQLILENTRHGLDAARKAGKQLGRPRLLSSAQVDQAQSLLRARSLSVREIASNFGVSRMTLHRAIHQSAASLHSASEAA